MGYIIFNGIDGRDKGVLMELLPDFHRPKRNVSYTPVSGRDGRLGTDDETYDAYQTSMRVNCNGRTLREVYAWLSGRGWMISSLEPDRMVDVDLHMQLSDNHWRTADNECLDTVSVSVYCQPYRYFYLDEPADEITAMPYTINNPGTAPSRPRITIEGTGDVTVIIGTQYAMDFTGLTEGVIVDCDMEECMSLDETQLLNNIATFEEFPQLVPGRNAISWNGNVTRITVEKRCRDL